MAAKRTKKVAKKEAPVQAEASSDADPKNPIGFIPQLDDPIAALVEIPPALIVAAGDSKEVVATQKKRAPRKKAVKKKPVVPDVGLQLSPVQAPVIITTPISVHEVATPAYAARPTGSISDRAMIYGAIFISCTMVCIGLFADTASSSRVMSFNESMMTATTGSLSPANGTSPAQSANDCLGGKMEVSVPSGGSGVEETCKAGCIYRISIAQAGTIIRTIGFDQTLKQQNLGKVVCDTNCFGSGSGGGTYERSCRPGSNGTAPTINQAMASGDIHALTAGTPEATAYQQSVAANPTGALANAPSTGISPTGALAGTTPDASFTGSQSQFPACPGSTNTGDMKCYMMNGKQYTYSLQNWISTGGTAANAPGAPGSYIAPDSSVIQGNYQNPYGAGNMSIGPNGQQTYWNTPPSSAASPPTTGATNPAIPQIPRYNLSSNNFGTIAQTPITDYLNNQNLKPLPTPYQQLGGTNPAVDQAISAPTAYINGEPQLGTMDYHAQTPADTIAPAQDCSGLSAVGCWIGSWFSITPSTPSATTQSTATAPSTTSSIPWRAITLQPVP